MYDFWGLRGFRSRGPVWRCVRSPETEPKRPILRAWLRNRRVPAVTPMLDLLREEASHRMRAGTLRP